MLFTPTMAEAFGDWLERERIHHALVRARPDLEGRLQFDEDRPLLRIPLRDGTTMLMAKTGEEPGTGWVLGVPDPQSPTVHETGTLSELVRRALAVLDARRPDHAAAP